MADELSPISSQWCLVGNIVRERPYGPGGQETRFGTRHFSPGTKVYCLPAQWGDGYERVIVIGRHRGSKEWVTMVINTTWVTNWRAKVVYEPAVLKRIQAATKESWKQNWSSKEEIEKYLAILTKDRSYARVSRQNIRVDNFGKRDVDYVIQTVKQQFPNVRIQQLQQSHVADDNGIWWFSLPDIVNDIQIESPDGMCPFLIETDEESSYHARKTETIEQTAQIVIDYLQSLQQE